jgi:hypothetical protein
MTSPGHSHLKLTMLTHADSTAPAAGANLSCRVFIALHAMTHYREFNGQLIVSHQPGRTHNPEGPVPSGAPQASFLVHCPLSLGSAGHKTDFPPNLSPRNAEFNSP